MKNIKSIAVFFLLVIMYSCNTEKAEKNVNLEIGSRLKVFSIQSTTKLNLKSTLIDKLSRHPDIEAFGKAELEKAVLTKFREDSNLQLISAPIVGSNKTLQAFYSVSRDGFLVTVFEHQGTYNKKGQFTGTNYLQARNGDILIENFRENKVIGSGIPNFSDPRARLEETCYKCMNRNYQLIKSECEKDMICDISCTLSPCFVIWAATALAGCTSGCCTGNPCNPFTNII